MLHSYSGRVRRKSEMSRASSAVSTMSSMLLVSGMHSSSSTSGMYASAVLRLFARFLRNLSSERFRVIVPRYAAKTLGHLGGTVFHTLRYVSFSHSVASSSLLSIRYAILRQKRLYFFCVSFTAVSSRCQKSSMIFLSYCFIFKLWNIIH